MYFTLLLVPRLQKYTKRIWRKMRLRLTHRTRVIVLAGAYCDASSHNILQHNHRLHAKYCSNYNKTKSNLANGKITVTSPRNSSFVFSRWQHRPTGLTWFGCNFATACYDWGFDAPKFPILMGSDSFLTMRHRTPQVYLPNGV